MARPPKLNPDRIKRIAKAITDGNTREAAAAAAGITPTSLYAWLRDAEHGANGLKAELLQAVRDADAKAEMRMVKIVTEAAKVNPTMAAWWLERRRPDQWGRRERIEIKHLIEQEAQRVAEELGLGDSAEVVQEVERILAASR